MGLWDYQCHQCGCTFLHYYAGPAVCPGCGRETENRLPQSKYMVPVLRSLAPAASIALLSGLAGIVYFLFYRAFPEVIPGLPVEVLWSVPVVFSVAFAAFLLSERVSVVACAALDSLVSIGASLAVFIATMGYYSLIIYAFFSILQMSYLVDIWFVVGLAIGLYIMAALPEEVLQDSERIDARLSRAYGFAYVAASPIYLLEKLWLPSISPLVSAVVFLALLVALAYYKAWAFSAWKDFSRTIVQLLLIFLIGMSGIGEAGEIVASGQWLNLQRWADFIVMMLVSLLLLALIVLGNYSHLDGVLRFIRNLGRSRKPPE